MKTLHLFAGAGGGLLADLILGNTPVGAVEVAPYPATILRERAADGWFPQLTVHEEDVREFDPTPYIGRVDCLSAGFPCQDISAAGRGAGITGERSGLISEVFRTIDAIRPHFVFLENSPNIRTKGRQHIIEQLVARGYAWRDGTIAASDVGAGHQRRRWFLLAADADRIRGRSGSEKRGTEWTNARRGEANGQYRDAPGDVANAVRGRQQTITRPSGPPPGREPSDGAYEAPADRLCNRLQIAIQRGGLSASDAETIQAAAGYVGAYDWSPPDSGVCRVVDGLAHRMDRIKCSGNGQVPLQAAAAFLILFGA